MCVTSLLCGPRADLWPFYGFLFERFSLYIKVYQGWALQRSGSTDPPKENGREFAPTAPIASKFRLGNTRQFSFAFVTLLPRRLYTERESKVANLCKPSRLKPSTEPRPDLRVTIERQRQGPRLKLLSLGVGDSLLLPFTSIQNNGSKRLSLTPTVCNLSLRPCRYLSTAMLADAHISSLGYLWRHPVQKSKFSACAVTGYCSFKQYLLKKPLHCCSNSK